MPQDLIAEARAQIAARLKAPSEPPVERTLDQDIADARARLLNRVDSFRTITPKFSAYADDEHTVTRVIDGDTIEVEGIGPVRLSGFNAPETVHPTKGVEPRGPESSALANIMLSGKKVKIIPKAGDERDVYGRMIAEVHLPDGRVANTELSGALDRYGAPSGAPLRDAAAARHAVASAASAGALRGLIYPVSSLVPELYDSLGKEVEGAQQQLHEFMQKPQVFQAMGRPDQLTQNILAGAPAVIGELAGMALPGMGLYKAAATTFGTGEAVALGERTLRHMSAATAAGAGFGIAAKLEDGESRFARVARDAVVAGASEMIFLPLMRRAWKKELGEAAGKAAKEYALSKGVSVAEAERKLTATRAGAAPQDFETAEEVVNLAKTVPEIKGSPLHVQSARALELLDTVLPKDPVVIDPHLDEGIALAFDLVVDQRRIPVRLPARSAAAQSQILEELDGVRAAVVRELSTGRDVKITSPMARDVRTWEFFKNRLLGRELKKAPEGKPLGAAPGGSVAETGKMPEVGSHVAIVEDTGQRSRAQVVDVGSWEPPALSTPGEPKIDPDPWSSVMPATRARLKNAGFTDADIGSLGELDLHVAASMATPGDRFAGRRGRTLREVREKQQQGLPIANVPDDPTLVERITHLSPKEAGDEGIDFPQYVSVITKHVLDGGELTEGQRRKLPYLADLERRVATRDAVEEVPVEVGRVKLPVVGENQETIGVREAARRTTPEEGEVFHPEGGLTDETKIRIEKRKRELKRAALAQDIERLKGDVAATTDPERKAKLESYLQNAQNDFLAVQDVADAPRRPGKVKKTPSGYIVVKGVDGRETMKPVSQVFVDVPSAPGEKLGRRPLVAHPDGGDRHGMVHLDSGEVSLEPIGANTTPGQSFYRSEMFTSVDPAKDWGRDIPIFVHDDGSVTLSVTPVNDVVQPKQASFGHLPEFGPVDRVSASRERSVSGVRRSGGEVLGFAEGQPPEFGRFPSTYVPRAIRGRVEVEKRYRPQGVSRPSEEFPDVLNLPRARENPELALDFESGEQFLVEGETPTVRVRGRKRPGTLPIAPGELRGMEVRTGLPLRRTPQAGPAEYSLTRDMLDTSRGDVHPEWATVRKTARIMQKQGYDPETPLKVRIAREMHRGLADEPSSITIREAAELELPMPNSDKLFEEASARGLKVLPKGKGATLFFPDGSRRTFEDELEALEAVQRIPVSQLDRSLDAPLARLWNTGVENGIDPEVDARKFTPVPLQEVALNQIVKGGRPLAAVATGDTNEFNSAFEALAQGKAKGLTVQTLEETGPNAARLAVYDPAAVQARIKQLGSQLGRLGINVEQDPRRVIQELDKLPQGLHILESSDPESSLMYTWFRQHSMKGNWQEGPVMLDETGPHRVFSDEQKNKFTFHICP